MKLGWNKGNEVRGHGQEELPHVRGQGRWPRGATPRLRSVVAGRRRPVQGRGGREKPPRAQGQGQCPRGATRGAVAVQAQEGLEELSNTEGQEGRQ